MIEGETFNLVATVLPKDAEYDGVTWASSNISVASVQSGTVAALKEGTATITASAGGKSSTCSVKVSAKVIAVTSITLDKTSLSMQVGETETMTATVSPADATDKSVAWSSSDVSVAIVADGKITAKRSGTATITAKSGNCTAKCVVTVSVNTESVILDKTTLSLAVGETAILTATVKPDDATDKKVTWSSSDESVAKVSDGKVTAVKSGKATITAKCGGKTAECSVTVTVPTGSVTLDKTTLSLAVGESAQLTATVSPADATDRNVIWTSSDESVAKVSDGKVTAVKAGKAMITAKCGDKTAECAVTVTVPVALVSLDKTTLSLAVGESAQLTATVNPTDATDRNVTWTSSDESVAKVSDGRVTAVKSGKATITAECGGKTAECAVTVTVPIGSVTLDKTTLSLAVGESAQLTATVSPADATDKNVIWSSSDESVAKVADGKVTAVKSGKATITAKCGGKSAECAVTVTVPTGSVTLDRTTLSLAVGESAQLTATVSPADATDKNVSWTSSDESVAKVADGKVTAVKSSKATITAQCGGKTAECAVTVTVPVASISLDKTSLSLVVGETATLTATVSPADATDKNVIWTSSDESVAKVADGKVTAVQAGKVTITAKCGDKTVKCSIVVTQIEPIVSYTTINGESVDMVVDGYDNKGNRLLGTLKKNNDGWDVLYDNEVCSIRLSSSSANLKSITVNKPVTLTSCYLRCPNLQRIDFGLSKVSIESTLTISCPKISFLDVSSFDTSRLTSMSGIFYDCTNLKKLDLSSWNTRNVKNMSRLFLGCNNLTSIDLSEWDTSHVTDMSGLFGSCYNLDSVDLSNWDTSNVSDMGQMFQQCYSLKSLDLSNWNTALLTDISYMFNLCDQLRVLDLSGWNTANIDNMSCMLLACKNIEILDISGWHIKPNTSTSLMFSGCNNLQKILMHGCDDATIEIIKLVKPAETIIVTE